MKTFSKEDLIGKTFIGEVLDAEDPEKEGKCKIKIFGLFNSEDPVIENGKPTGDITKIEIPKEEIPWASPANGKFFAGGETKGFGDISIPKIGTIVKVIFPTGDMYAPEWTFIHNLNVQAVEEIQESYPGSHIMIYDNDIPEGGLKIFYTESKGLNIFFKSSQIVINPDSSITIEHKESASIIELVNNVINIVSTKEINITSDDVVNVTATKTVNVKTETAMIDASKSVEVKSDKVIIDHASTIELGKGASEKAVLGNKLLKLFNSHTHIGNMGAPTSPPTKPMTPSELSQKNVKVK